MVWRRDYYESHGSNVEQNTVEELLDEGNEWSSFNDIVQVEDTAIEKARKEWRKYEKWCHPAYLPVMEPTRIVGAVDEEDEPKNPIYELGRVIKRGKNMENGLNHADYIDGSGIYDALKFFSDVKSELLSLSNVFCGQLAPRVPTEVGCESLFSSSGHANDARRSRMDIRLYERLIIGKHRMNRMYISSENVKKRYMEKYKNNRWDEEEERDNKEYLEQEQEIWKEEYPLAANRMLQEEEEDAGEIDNEENADSNDEKVSDQSSIKTSESESESESDEDSSDEEHNSTKLSALAGNVTSPGEIP